MAIRKNEKNCPRVKAPINSASGSRKFSITIRKDRIADEKQSGQNSVRLAGARPHKPQNREQNNPFEERLVKLRRMARRQN